MVRELKHTVIIDFVDLNKSRENKPHYQRGHQWSSN